MFLVELVAVVDVDLEVPLVMVVLAVMVAAQQALVGVTSLVAEAPQVFGPSSVVVGVYSVQEHQP